MTKRLFGTLGRPAVAALAALLVSLGIFTGTSPTLDAQSFGVDGEQFIAAAAGNSLFVF